jgi:hypothetical protein
VLRWSEADGPETIVELVLDDVAEGTRLVVLELPAARLQAVARVLEQASPFTGGSSLGTRGGPQMVVALA